MIKNRFYFLLIALFFATPFTSYGISVSQSVDKFEIAYEDSLTFEIKLQWEGPQFAYYFDKPLSPYFDRLKVRGFSSSISSTGESGSEITTKKFKFVLIPIGSGNVTIESVPISYIAMPDSIPGELMTEAMSVTIAPAIPKKVESNEIPFWITVISMALLISGGLFIFIKKRAKPEEEEFITPKEQFLTGLTELKKNAGSDMKIFQSGLYDLLVSYLFDAQGILVSDESYEELENKLSECNLSEAQSVKVFEWITKARKDKFRPVSSSPGETIRLESEIRNYFENI